MPVAIRQQFYLRKLTRLTLFKSHKIGAVINNNIFQLKVEVIKIYFYYLYVFI